MSRKNNSQQKESTMSREEQEKLRTKEEYRNNFFENMLWATKDKDYDNYTKAVKELDDHLRTHGAPEDLILTLNDQNYNPRSFQEYFRNKYGRITKIIDLEKELIHIWNGNKYKDVLLHCLNSNKSVKESLKDKAEEKFKGKIPEAWLSRIKDKIESGTDYWAKIINNLQNHLEYIQTNRKGQTNDNGHSNNQEKTESPSKQEKENSKAPPPEHHEVSEADLSPTPEMNEAVAKQKSLREKAQKIKENVKQEAEKSKEKEDVEWERISSELQKKEEQEAQKYENEKLEEFKKSHWKGTDEECIVYLFVFSEKDHYNYLVNPQHPLEINKISNHIIKHDRRRLGAKDNIKITNDDLSRIGIQLQPGQTNNFALALDFGKGTQESPKAQYTNELIWSKLYENVRIEQSDESESSGDDITEGIREEEQEEDEAAKQLIQDLQKMEKDFAFLEKIEEKLDEIKSKWEQERVLDTVRKGFDKFYNHFNTQLNKLKKDNENWAKEAGYEIKTHKKIVKKIDEKVRERLRTIYADKDPGFLKNKITRLKQAIAYHYMASRNIANDLDKIKDLRNEVKNQIDNINKELNQKSENENQREKIINNIKSSLSDLKNKHRSFQVLENKLREENQNAVQSLEDLNNEDFIKILRAINDIHGIRLGKRTSDLANFVKGIFRR